MSSLFIQFSPRGHVMRTRNSRRRGFSLVELLSVMVVIGVVSSLMVPAMSGLFSAGQTRVGAEQLGGYLREAGIFARANSISVQVGVHQTNPGEPDNEVFLQCLYPLDGGVDQTPEAMADTTLWKEMGRMVRISGIRLEDSGIGSPIFQRTAGGESVEFLGLLKILPDGTVRDGFGMFERQVVLEVSDARRPSDVFLVDVTSSTGRVRVSSLPTSGE